MKMTQQQEQIYKKKKKKRKTLITDFNALDNDEIIKTISEIRIKLKKIFKFHIGIDESISPYDLFTEIFNIKPEDLDIYKRGFWYDVLKKVIKQLRKENEVFIILDRSRIYVLQSDNELNKYKKVINQDITNLSKAKLKAEKWVKTEKWRDF